MGNIVILPTNSKFRSGYLTALWIDKKINWVSAFNKIYKILLDFEEEVARLLSSVDNLKH